MFPWKRFLLFAHLGLLIAAIALGRWLYAGALGQSDVLTVINPYPQVAGADILAHYPVNPYPHIPTRSGHIASNIFVYVQDWYQGMNGRLSVATMNSLIACAAKQWCPTPESFPWWLMRALSLYCLLATALNFMTAVGWAWARRPGMTIMLLAAVWPLWIINPKIYVFSVIYDCLLIDQHVHWYILSWMIIAVICWMGKSIWKWGLLAIGILFLGSEQNFFSALVLLLAAAWLGLEGSPAFGGATGDQGLPAKGGAAGDQGSAAQARAWVRQAVYYGACTCLAAAIFFLSPGQQLKNTCLPINSIGDFSILKWYYRAVMLGYGAIFPRAPDSLWLWHLMLYGGLGLIMAAWGIVRVKKSAAGQTTDYCQQKMFGIGLMAFAFLTAFPASMTTLIVSSYFPPYAVCYPSLLLLLGLAFSFWFVLDGMALLLNKLALLPQLTGIKSAIKWIKDGVQFILPAVVAVALIWSVTVPSWPAVKAGYHEVMEQNRARRQIYAEIMKQYDTTGQRHFILMNLWKAPTIYLSMDQVWAMAGYFRWRGKDIVCLTEDEWNKAGRPQEQLYFKLDCAKMNPLPWKKRDGD